MRIVTAPTAAALRLDDDLVVHGDNAHVLPLLPDAAFDLVYVDPPFNTGSRRTRRGIVTERDEDGDRTGFGGARYRTRTVGGGSYPDAIDDYPAFIRPRLEQARRLLAPWGTLYVHLDYREAHHVKVMLDEVFGRDRSRYHFDAGEVDREPYMAPGLVTPEKAARGKLPTDVWWHTIVGTSSREKTGYPTQKPEGVVRRIVTASSRPGGWCLDFFAGSGTLGAVAAGLGRRYVLVDESAEAVAVMRHRLDGGAGVSRPAPADDPAGP